MEKLHEVHKSINNFIISWYCVVLIVANTTVCCIFKRLLHHFCHIWFILNDFT